MNNFNITIQEFTESDDLENNTKMCKSKKKLTKGVIEPSSRVPKTTPTSQSSESFAASSTTSSFFRNNNLNKDYYNSWQSASSSNVSSSKSVDTSLSSDRLRQSILSRDKPHLYDFSEIRSATNNFLLKPFYSSSSSTSWRSVIRDADVVIAQRKFRRLMEISELVERLAHICKSHHASLIKLKGASISGNYIYLVYDYIQGASLSHCLRNPRNPKFTMLSTWMSRIQVASDVAHGLDYIHNSTGLGFGFVHNHIKSSSIIVTEPSFAAKICHFGTAELCGEIAQPSEGKVVKFEGTRGYMAPEFQSSGVATQQTDVYAFGVVVLELLSGEEALSYSVDDKSGGYVRRSVIETARKAADGGGGAVRSWVDRRLKDSYPVEVVEKMVRLGLECVADDPDTRPDMGKVAGQISQFYLDSQTWAQKMGTPLDFSVSMAPR